MCLCSAACGGQRTRRFCVYQPHLRRDPQHFLLPRRCIFADSCSELHGYLRPPTCAGVRGGNDVPIFLDMRRQISITAGGSSLESSVDRLSQGLRSGINRRLESSSALYSWEKRAMQASRSGCSQQGVSPDHCVGLHGDF